MSNFITIGANIEQGSSTPLMEAAQEGHVDLVKFVLEKGKCKLPLNGKLDMKISCPNKIHLPSGLVLPSHTSKI